ncbi:GNAT family N-acetyltransferase [[Mycoplasma] cavipharyngis]|uniref:GNAT family N-acetyltransferase n=1 Tax=[Mycoplasma] cavipharyngis TaxID=92757 RepID=UPI0037041FFC
MVLLKFSDHSDAYYQASLLFQQSFHEKPNAFHYLWQASDLNHSYFFRSNNSSEIIGMCLNTTKTFNLVNQAKISTISLSCVCIAPKYRKQGLSRIFLDQVIKKVENEFDYILLQAENFNYYRHLNFYDAINCYQTEWIPQYDNQLLINLKIYKYNQLINWKQLYCLFQNDQKRHNCQWLLSYDHFVKFSKYKLVNQEIIYHYQTSFCFVDSDQLISAYGFSDVNHFIELLNHLPHQKLTLILDQEDFDLINQKTKKLLVQNKVLMVQINQKSGRKHQFCLWSYFV